jgi:hypothetical protein
MNVSAADTAAFSIRVHADEQHIRKKSDVVKYARRYRGAGSDTGAN